jgi:hypothetical protein
MRLKSKHYTTEYFEEISKNSLRSAKEIVPLIFNYFTPKSVIDIGCGIGAWLSVWQQHGVNDILGIDGNYIDREQLLINADNFLAVELETDIKINRRFDLVMSLEVAEHIKPEFASNFVRTLCSSGDIVLFSAAIPNQGGVLHYNEQYPQYWIEKFKEFGFLPYDCIRNKIWENSRIDVNYRQNILFFIKEEKKGLYPLITNDNTIVLPLVHPLHFQHKQDIIRSYQNTLRTPFHAGWYFLKKYYNYLISKLGYGNKNGSGIS